MTTGSGTTADAVPVMFTMRQAHTRPSGRSTRIWRDRLVGPVEGGAGLVALRRSTATS